MSLSILSVPIFRIFTEPILNPVALIKAKTVHNFGLSECNRVKHVHVCLQTEFSSTTKVTLVTSLTLLHSERPNLYTILAFLSAIDVCLQTVMNFFDN